MLVVGLPSHGADSWLQPLRLAWVLGTRDPSVLSRCWGWWGQELSITRALLLCCQLPERLCQPTAPRKDRDV